jgi:hypothetical protein
LAKNLDVGPLHSKLRASANHASSFLYSNAAVPRIEHCPKRVVKKETDIFLREDFITPAVSRGLFGHSKTPSACRENCPESRSISGQPFELPESWM